MGDSAVAISNVCLDFFGVGVSAQGVPHDIAELAFIFKRYMSADVVPEITVSIRCLDWPERGFFQSLLSKDGLRKHMEIRYRGGNKDGDDITFTDWSGAPSPFPPFYHSSLWTRLATHPGAIVRLSDGPITAIIGDHYVGKTSTAIALCRRGARLISDSLMVFETNTRTAHTFETPLGFRRESLLRLIPNLHSLDYRLSVSPDTGLVALVQPEQVLGTANVEGGTVDRVVVLKRSDSEFSVRIAPTPPLGWFTGSEPSRTASLLPQEAVHIECANAIGPDALAELIEVEVRK